MEETPSREIRDEPRDNPRDSLPEEGDPPGGSAEQHDDPGDKNCSSTDQERKRENCSIPLPPGCNPVEWVALRWEEVAAHRNLLCSHYGDCLEYAGLSAWQGMSCSRCRHFIEVIRKASGKGARSAFAVRRQGKWLLDGR